MNISHGQLRQARKDFKKTLADIKRDEVRILASLGTEIDRQKSQHLLQSLQPKF
ncbi:MAG: hypothetical protein AAB400_04095 [Patescibacteria group bacterium]